MPKHCTSVFHRTGPAPFEMLIHLKWTKTQIWRRNVCFWNLQVSWCACCWSRRWLATWSSKRSMAALSTSREKSTKCPHQRPKLSSPVSHWSCPMMWCCRYLWKKGTVHRRIGQQQGSYGFRLHYPHEKAISWKKKNQNSTPCGHLLPGIGMQNWNFNFAERLHVDF